MPFHPSIMQQAIALAIENVTRGTGGPFAAVVVKQGSIIATGTNRVTTANDPTAHAEIVAIREACATLNSFQLDGCELYTTCEPCPMCLGAIYWARPARVFFSCSRHDAASAGFDDSFIYDEVSTSPEERTIPMTQGMREEGLEVFKAWEQNEKKIRY
jgi:guanine deaminase